MKVRKVATLNNTNEIIGLGSDTSVAGEIIRFAICNGPTTDLAIPVTIGTGNARRQIMLDAPIGNSVLEDQALRPVPILHPRVFEAEGKEYRALFLFRDQFFLATTQILEGTSEEKAVLLIKREVFSEDDRLKKLKQDVAVLEGLTELTNTPKRTPIPDAVKLFVYARDEGKCVRCGSNHSLHFDHIIPVIKGGSNIEENIQILCAECNLRKSDKIAF